MLTEIKPPGCPMMQMCLQWVPLDMKTNLSNT